MISKNLLNKIEISEFQSEAQYFGIAIDSGGLKPIEGYVDLEVFFLKATYNLTSSRILEGFLCWLIRYGHLLSPSKIRRLIKLGVPYDSSVMGGFISFLMINNINKKQWLILKAFARKSRQPQPLLKGPVPKNPNADFLKYNVIIHNVILNEEKFLTPIVSVFKRCLPLKNRALFGSCVNADVASYLAVHPDARPYEISKETANHKARVFAIYEDIQKSLAA